jgi:hypothetical protein
VNGPLEKNEPLPLELSSNAATDGTEFSNGLLGSVSFLISFASSESEFKSCSRIVHSAEIYYVPWIVSTS